MRGYVLPVLKSTCSYVIFKFRLRVFFRTESNNLRGTNWYLATCTFVSSIANFSPRCSPSLVVKYFYCPTLCLRGHPMCWRTVIPMSHLFSASLSITFVIDASWLIPTTLTEVTSASILLTTTHFALMSTDGTIHVCQLSSYLLQWT